MTEHDDRLASWRDGATRRAIIDFVEAVSTGPEQIPAVDRVAVFDNDGTLWTERPMPTQLHYVVQKWAEAARLDPSLAEREPYAGAVAGDAAWLRLALEKHYAGDDADLHVVIAALVRITLDQSVEEYQHAVTAFYREAKHLALDRAYSTVVYQPMIELLGYLESHDFTCYIVSGGDRDFMRPITDDYYGIPPERVIGSAVDLRYDGATNDVRYSSKLDFFDDGPEKPIRIWSRIGRRPVLAAGNSNGDIPMLRYVQKHPRSLSLLVHHDDDTGRGDEPYDRGAEEALAAAAGSGFTVVSVEQDWSAVFPAEGASRGPRSSLPPGARRH